MGARRRRTSSGSRTTTLGHEIKETPHANQRRGLISISQAKGQSRVIDQLEKVGHMLEFIHTAAPGARVVPDNDLVPHIGLLAQFCGSEPKPNQEEFMGSSGREDCIQIDADALRRAWLDYLEGQYLLSIEVQRLEDIHLGRPSIDHYLSKRIDHRDCRHVYLQRSGPEYRGQNVPRCGCPPPSHTTRNCAHQSVMRNLCQRKM